MTLKLYFMKCPERKISQCILPFRDFTKFAGLRPATLFKKRPWHRCFPVKISKNIFFYRINLVAASLLKKPSSFNSFGIKFCLKRTRKERKRKVWF